jgi:hypothetical protein
MTRLADAIQRAAETAVVQNSAGWMLAVVDTVHLDGTADVDTARGPVLSVRYLRGWNPAPGDHVMVATNPSGNWLIVGALATGPDPA